MTEDGEKLIAAYLIVAKFRKLPLKGKTYGEILSETKELNEKKKFNQ